MTTERVRPSPEPKISVIIPTHDRPEYVGQAIDSVLAQSYGNLEVLVSDNASDAAAFDLIQRHADDPRVSVNRNESDVGMVNNWKQAVERYATGEWFLILSDDDYLIDTTYFARAMEVATSSDRVVLVLADGYISENRAGTEIDRRRLGLRLNRISDGRDVFAARGASGRQDFMLCNVLFKRNVALSLQPFTNPNNLSADTELFLQMCLLGDVGFIEAAVSVYRIHEQNAMKRLRIDAIMRVENLDSLLVPYLRARETIEERYVREFVRNSGIARMIKRTLFAVLLDDSQAHERLQRKLRTLDGTPLNSAVHSLDALAIYVFCTRLPTLARLLRRARRAVKTW